MRLRLFSAAGIAFILALALAACGGGGSSASSSGGSTTSSNSNSSYKPSVRLECKEAPCGSNPSKNESHGWYEVVETNFPPYTLVLVTATYPNGDPYPVNQYTPPGELYGIHGDVQHTNKYGELPELKWATLNEYAPVDPPGEYKLTFHFKYHGELVEASAIAKMEKLP